MTPWTVVCQAPLPTEFSRQEQWSGLQFPSPGDLPYPGIDPLSPVLHTDPFPSEPLRIKSVRKREEPKMMIYFNYLREVYIVLIIYKALFQVLDRY